MAGETPAAAGPQTETFAPHSQSITFGLDSHAVFFNALRGLANDGQIRMVQVATWRDDWNSIHEPQRYLLLSVVRREDMGVAGLVIEAAPGYAFLTPCTPEGIALPDAVSVIVPSMRIARLHLPRRGEYSQVSDSERQTMDHLEASGAMWAARPMIPKPRALQLSGSLRTWLSEWRRVRTSVPTSLPPAPDPAAVPTLVDWINTLPTVAAGPASEPAMEGDGWVIPDGADEDTGSGHSQVA